MTNDCSSMLFLFLEGRADPEVAAYLQRQQKRGRLADLWAKAEVSSLEQSNPDDLKASVTTALNTTLPEEEMVKDDEVYIPYAQGTLGQVTHQHQLLQR